MERDWVLALASESESESITWKVIGEECKQLGPLECCALTS